MLHSSGQIKRNDEEEIARLNREYIDEKREQLRLMREGAGRGGAAAEPKKKKFSGYCCLFLIALAAVCGYVIYYFVINVKDPILQDYYQKKSAIEQAIPQGKAELEKGIEQGEALYNETTGTAEELNKKFDQAKETVEQVQETVDAIKKIKEEITP